MSPPLTGDTTQGPRTPPPDWKPVRAVLAHAMGVITFQAQYQHMIDGRLVTGQGRDYLSALNDAADRIAKEDYDP